MLPKSMTKSGVHNEIVLYYNLDPSRLKYRGLFLTLPVEEGYLQIFVTICRLHISQALEIYSLGLNHNIARKKVCVLLLYSMIKMHATWFDLKQLAFEKRVILTKKKV